MKTLTAPQAPPAARPAPKRLMLHKETLRRLTPTELRLAAGGAGSSGGGGNTSGSVSCFR